MDGPLIWNERRLNLDVRKHIPAQQVEHEHGTVDPVAGAEGRLVPVAVAEDIVGVKGPHSYAYK